MGTGKQHTEAGALAWFERSLALEPAERAVWLASQDMPEPVRARVLRLLAAEARSEGFLQSPAPTHASLGFPRVGDLVGRYQLLEEIDAGGMGVVFRARRADEAFDQVVAVKLIRPFHLGAEPGVRNALLHRFEQERNLLARLEHPNIARILDGGATDAGIPFLAMEFVDGEPLTRWCDSKALDVRARMRLLAGVCAGVQEAHRHLIVHRDLKPENVLVDRDGRPRLLDFGIARTLDDSSASTGTTALSAMTPAYASPEQLRGQPITTGSDVYSLGVILHELVAGMRPYDLAGLSPAQAEHLVCETAVPTLRQTLARAGSSAEHRARRAAQIDDDLERIAAKALHKDPARRYASARELGDDIERWLRGEPVLAHPDSAAYRLRKFVGRHRLATAATAVASIALLAATAAAVTQASSAKRAAADTRLINQYLLGILEQSDPYESGGELTLREAVDHAAGEIDAHFPGRPDLASEIRFGIGYSQLSRFQLEDAEANLLAAERDSTAAFGARDIRTLRVREAIANLRLEQGRPDVAEHLYEALIADIDAAGLDDSDIHLTAVNNLGMLLLTQERYPDADRRLQQTLDILRRSGNEDPTQTATVLSNLAQAAHGLEDYERAAGLYRDALREYAASHPSGSADASIVLNNLAMLEDDRGQHAQALALHRQSLAMRRRVMGGEHPLVVVGLIGVARSALRMGDVADALRHAREAAAMADRVYAAAPNPRHPGAHLVLAEARLREGDRAAALHELAVVDRLIATVDAPPKGLVGDLARTRAAACAGADAAAARPCRGMAR